MADEAIKSSNGSDSLTLWQLGFYGVGIPVVAVPGLFGSSLSLVVLTRRRMQSSLNCLLAGLSFFDFVLLLMALCVYPPMVYCRADFQFWCRAFQSTIQISYPIMLICQFCSVWTCVLITIDRYIAVKHPIRNKLLCTTQRAFTSLVLVFVCGVMFRIPTMLELERNANGYITRSALRQTKDYIKIYHLWLSTPLLFVLPWSVLIIVNFVTSWEIRRVVHRRASMRACGQRHQTHTTEERERRSTMMAVLVICTFLLFNALQVINHLLEALWGLEDMTPSRRLLIFSSNFLVCLNSTVNFVIYCILGYHFFSTCRQVLSCRPAVTSLPMSMRASRANTESMASFPKSSVSVLLEMHPRSFSLRNEANPSPIEEQSLM